MDKNLLPKYLYNYVHDQSVASNIWTISHNLNKFPQVQIFDNSGNEIFADIRHITVNQVQITFYTTITGKAYLT